MSRHMRPHLQCTCQLVQIRRREAHAGKVLGMYELCCIDASIRGVSCTAVAL